MTSDIPTSSLAFIPEPDAGWQEIIDFAHTFDGYKHWGSFDRCAEIANAATQQFEATGAIQEDLDVIRTCLFFEARRWRHGGYEPSDDDRPYIAHLLEQLRSIEGTVVKAPVTANDLYRFILANVEEIDGQQVCRVSLIAELRRRGIKKPGAVRAALVRELTGQGLVVRPHPRSGWLFVTPNEQTRSALKSITGGLTGFHHDARATSRRAQRLQRYMTNNVLAGKRFVCSSWHQCESSIAPGCTFKEGQLSHLGKHYDLSRAGKMLRVVVVGQEAGGRSKPHTTMMERYGIVHDRSGLKHRFDGDSDHKRRNPHMRGTTLALRTIFGVSGTGHATEFLDVGGKSVHIFDCFALVNRLLCAAHLAGTSTGKSTKTMLNNCERHFQATLEILEPTIVVIQGIKVWKWSKNVLVPVKQRTENLFECELAGRRVMVAAFTHPSAWGPDRWDSPTSTYFREVVKPTLRRAAGSSR